jgi:hypothetical protein
MLSDGQYPLIYDESFVVVAGDEAFEVSFESAPPHLTSIVIFGCGAMNHQSTNRERRERCPQLYFD